MCQPGLHLGGFVRGEVVQDQVHVQLDRHVAVNDPQEAHEVLGGVSIPTVGQHLPGGDVEGRIQVGGAVALVVVGHGSRSARPHGQSWLGPVQGLALGLLVDAEHHSALGRVQVQPHHVHQLLFEGRIIGDLEGLHLPRLEVVVLPDLPHTVLADPHSSGQAPSGPVGGAISRQFLLRQSHHLRHRPLGQPRLAAPTGANHSHPRHTPLWKAPPPTPDCVGAHAHAPSDLVVGHPFASQQQSSRLQHRSVTPRSRLREPLQRRPVFPGHRQRFRRWHHLHTASLWASPIWPPDH